MPVNRAIVEAGSAGRVRADRLGANALADGIPAGAAARRTLPWFRNLAGNCNIIGNPATDWRREPETRPRQGHARPSVRGAKPLRAADGLALPVFISGTMNGPNMRMAKQAASVIRAGNQY